MSLLKYAAKGSPGNLSEIIGWIDFETLSLAPNNTSHITAKDINDNTIEFDISNTTKSGAQLIMTATKTPLAPRFAFGNTGYIGIDGNVALYSNFPTGPAESIIAIKNLIIKDKNNNIIKDYYLIVANPEATAIISRPTVDDYSEETIISGETDWAMIENLSAPAPNSVGPNIIGNKTNTVTQVGTQVLPDGPVNDPVFATFSPVNFDIELCTGASGREGFCIGIIIPCSQYRAVTDLIQSVADEQKSISHILNAEGEKLQKIADNATTNDELSCVNKSVQSTINAVTRLETVLQGKLRLFNKILCKKIL